MRRSLQFLLFFCIAMFLPVGIRAQQPSSPQDVPVVQNPQPPEAQAPAEQNPSAQQEQQPEQKKGSKISRKLRGALPDCISIIFSKCWTNDARQQQAEEKEAERRAHAEERCKAIEEARAKRTPPVPTAPPPPPGESSSKSSESVNPMGCTVDDVLRAEHDVDVGDFYMQNGNKKAAEMRYRDALKSLPDDPVATLHLAKLLEKQGRNQEALGLYRSYMSWSPTGKEADEAHKSIAKLEAGK